MASSCSILTFQAFDRAEETVVLPDPGWGERHVGVWNQVFGSLVAWFWPLFRLLNMTLLRSPAMWV